uniref:NADH-ubiquinone oxidoreductase chain 2 n=1 Tax=Chicoreus torrefactus TaxID=693199 RepID=A0A345WJ27_9CAEN|nr:NADH dehydrogenase subunit 2 [Chicoreus torrefactus]AXJ93070.1 NADH dehydrogenase subunit 2 [Chicoreus torrefactus]
MFSALPFGYMFLMVMSVGTFLSISSVHWLGIWAGLEINLIGFLPLLVYQKSALESESAVKYFIVQALGSSLLIFGSLSSFGVSFTWDVFSRGENLETFGLLMMLSGLCMKLGLFPFHYWLPSVMAGLPWPTCLLLATWQKIAPLFLMVCLLELSEYYMLICFLCVVSAGSSLVGGLGGMNQTQIRALLAYSSIGHLGWMVCAVLHSEWSMKFYLLVYIVISLCMFFSLWKSDLSTMKDIDSLKMNKVNQMNIMLLLLSLGGLPPLLGFVSKWSVILVGTSNPWLPLLLVLIVGSLMSLFYYLTLFFSVFVSSVKGEVDGKMNKEGEMTLVLAVILNIFGGVFLLMNGLIFLL